MPRLHEINLTVNGEKVVEYVEPRTTLADFLREQMALTGTHVGCEHGVCGACTVLVDGVSIRSCLTFAVQMDGADIQTIEGHGSKANLSDIQAAFKKHHALQCGFCTPGFLATVKEMLDTMPLKSDEEIRDALSGNICRCTGYEHIVNAVKDLAEQREGKTS